MRRRHGYDADSIDTGTDALKCCHRADYVVQPYGFPELIARIEAVMRRAHPQPAASKILCGPLRIDFAVREVHLHDRRINLTRKEFDLLHLLASQPDSVVSRQHIMSIVWDDDWMSSSRTIDTHVNGLRKKLGASAWIITIRGVSLRFGSDRNASEQ